VSLTERWDRWWFAGRDPRNAALLRIGYGLLCLWQILELWPDRHMLLGRPGLMPVALRDGAWQQVSAFAWVDDPTPLLVVWGVAALMLAGGVLSRFSMLACWFFIVSVSFRGGAFTDGSDALMRVFGLYMLFLEVGTTWSVDAWWRRRKGLPIAEVVSGWPLRLMLLNLCILYVKTGLIKAPNGAWHEGTAVFYALSSPTFWRFDLFGLLQQGWVQTWSVGMTYATLVFEIGFPLVLFRRFRHPWLLFGLALHGGVILFMNLGLFTPAVLWVYLAIVELPGWRASRAALT
jgi:hypothetical protein